MNSYNTYMLLQDSFLKNVLRREKALQKGIEVQLFGDKKPMTIQGFVPLPEYDGCVSSIFIEFNAYKIGVNRIKFPATIIKTYPKTEEQMPYVVYPILDEISIALDEYLIDSNTTIIEYKHLSKYHYLNLSPNGIPPKIKDTILKDSKFSRLIEKEEGFVYKTGNEYELKKICADDNKLFIAKEFVCLCSYTNPLNGKFEMQLFNPDDLVVVLPKSANNEE